MKFTRTKKAVKDIYDKYAYNWLSFIMCTCLIIITISIASVAIISVIAGIWWIMWQIWLYSIPQFFPNMPYGFQYPDYTSFVCGLCLLLWLRGFIRSFFKPFNKDTE